MKEIYTYQLEITSQTHTSWYQSHETFISTPLYLGWVFSTCSFTKAHLNSVFLFF